MTDYLKEYIYNNIKTAVELSTTGLDYGNVKFWDTISYEFNCSENKDNMTIEIEWLFNGKTTKKKFKYGESVILTSETDCSGSYGPCVNFQQTWGKAFDAFPTTKICYPKMPFSCVPPASSPPPVPSASPSTTSSPSASPSPTSSPSASPSPPSPSEKPWYKNKLYIGLIAGGFFFFIIVIVLLASRKSPPPPPPQTV